MLLIKTTLKQSPIHGIGVFADEFISAGTMIGLWNPIIDVTLERDFVHKLAEPSQTAIRHYAYLDKADGKYKLNSDNMRFFNHSSSPNTYQTCDADYAITDIQPGEELTCDYYLFDLEADRKIMR